MIFFAHRNVISGSLLLKSLSALYKYMLYLYRATGDCQSINNFEIMKAISLP